MTWILDFNFYLKTRHSTVGQFFKKPPKINNSCPCAYFFISNSGIGKIARGIRIWAEKFEKSLFSGSKRPFCGFDHFG
jgi:hypothetical protein